MSRLKFWRTETQPVRAVVVHLFGVCVRRAQPCRLRLSAASQLVSGCVGAHRGEGCVDLSVQLFALADSVRPASLRIRNSQQP